MMFILCFQLSKIQTHECCKIGLSISECNRGFTPCCPLLSAFLLTNPWYKLNAIKLLIIFFCFPIQILRMCYLQLILSPPVLSERREAITGAFTKTRYPFHNYTHSELWKLAVWSLSWESNFLQGHIEMEWVFGEGWCCLWPPHYVAEIATICNSVFVQHRAPVSALSDVLRHRFITQKTLIVVNV